MQWFQTRRPRKKAVPQGKTWESEVAAAFVRPSFTPTRTVNVTSQAQLNAANTDLQAGDKVVATSPFTYAGQFQISKQLLDFAEFHLDLVTFSGTAAASALPTVWINNAKKIRMYGGLIDRSGGYGLTVYASEDCSWWDFVAKDCESHGVQIPTSIGAVRRLSIKCEIYNVGLNWDQDPHVEKGTGLHAVYLGGSTGGIFDLKLAIDAHDIDNCSGDVQVNDVYSAELWLRGKRLSFVATQQTGANVVQFWGSPNNNVVIRYLEGEDIQGHGVFAIGQSPNLLSDCSVEYGRCSNYSQNPGMGDWAWTTDGAMVYDDVEPQDFGSGN